METTTPNRAVEIAKDVLLHLQTTTFREGSYINRYPSKDAQPKLQSAIESGWDKADLRDFAPIAEKECTVCALGGYGDGQGAPLRRGQDVRDVRRIWHPWGPTSGMYYLQGRSSACDNALDDFPMRSREMIETCFELSGIHADNEQDALAAVAFGLRASLAAEDQTHQGQLKARVKATMENVIQNNGEFLPPPVASLDAFHEEFDASYTRVHNFYITDAYEEFGISDDEDDGEYDDDLDDDDFEDDDEFDDDLDDDLDDDDDDDPDATAIHEPAREPATV